MTKRVLHFVYAVLRVCKKEAVTDVAAFFVWQSGIDYLLPGLVLVKKGLYTLSIAAQSFYGDFLSDYGLMTALLPKLSRFDGESGDCHAHFRSKASLFFEVRFLQTEYRKGKQ